MQVAEALSVSKEKAVEAHARDELGIDLEDLDEKTNPWQVRRTRILLLHASVRSLPCVSCCRLQLSSCDNGSVSLQAAIASAVSFTIGGIIPLLGGVFIGDPWIRLAVVAVCLFSLRCMHALCSTSSFCVHSCPRR